MKKDFDIIVIGAGSGGLNIAGFMNKAGFKVCLIDKSDKAIGGDCLNHGCIPSKALIHIARGIAQGKKSEKFMTSESVNEVKREGKYEGGHEGRQIDLIKVMDEVRLKQDIIREHENAEYFKSIGMAVVLGLAKFTSKNSVEVNGIEYKAKKIIIATGSRPIKIDIKGNNNDVEKNIIPVYTNETIFNIKTLPKNLLVIGGGPIGIELGQAFSMIGSKVTIVHKGSRILEKEDTEIADTLATKLVSQGINILLKSEVSEILDESNQPKVKIKGLGDSETETLIDCDAILLAIGRKLNIDNLDLDKAGIEIEKNNSGTDKIKVNKYLQTTNKRVFLCGDVVGQHQFTHAAELHAALIIRNFFAPVGFGLFGNLFKKKLNTDSLSWVTYTSPEIATFGINEKTLIERGENFEILTEKFTHDDRAITDEYRDGLIKLFVGIKGGSKGKLLGGTLISPIAGEIVQELILAQSSGLPIKHIFNKIYPYPTASRINKRVVTKYFARSLNGFVKKVLKVLY